MPDKLYDIIIIGGGPAGMAAAIYAARFKLNAVVLTKMPGGLIVTAHLIENYPGFASISGAELAEHMKQHVKKFNVPMVEEEVIDIKRTKNGFDVRTKENVYAGRTVLFATGTERRKLGVPGEAQFAGRGVSYCAVCDGPFFRGKTVAVIGGSDAAAKEALLMSQWASKVYIIYRKENLRAEPATIETVSKNSKIEIISNANVVEIKGGKMVESVLLDTGEDLRLEGVFIEIGGVPTSAIAKALGVDVNERGEIIIDKNGCTNAPDIFAAGDVTDRQYKQAITAAAEGSAATFSAYKYIKGM